MKKNGFTLIELLACLVVLSLIMLIVFPFILNGYNEAQKQSYDAQITYIETAAKTFAEENKQSIEELSVLNRPYTVTIQYLYDRNYLDLPLKNPLSNRFIDPALSTAKITRTSDKKFSVDVSIVDQTN